ncbi:LuxR C-terminal-related transcriptional regulator [Paraburkholderia sp. BR14263]|uniref:LuxR C-terminal-related transcriptional regulator n=1 Tax=unclassified Paraburkholderia TaxID=2615204 RepID=UPI0034CF229A
MNAVSALGVPGSHAVDVDSSVQHALTEGCDRLACEVRIVLVSGYALVRAAIVQLLTAHCGMKVVADLDAEVATIAAASNLVADLVMFDATASRGDCLTIVRKLRDRQPAIPILVLGSSLDAAAIPMLVRAGASGCIASESAAETLIDAARKMAAGERYIDPRMVDAVFFGQPCSSVEQAKRLSHRESQVLQLITSGCTPSNIARELSLSIKTVSTHKARLMKKLNVQSNADLVRYALRHGLAQLN